MLVIVFIILELVIALLLVLASLFLIEVAKLVVEFLFGEKTNLDLAEKMGFSYVVLIFMVLLPISWFRFISNGLNLCVAIMGRLLVPLGIGGLYITIKKGYVQSLYKSIKNGYHILTPIAGIYLIYFLIYIVQSIDCQWDVFTIDEKSILWGLFTDSLSTGLTQYLYLGKGGNPYVWIRPIINAVLNIEIDLSFVTPVVVLFFYGMLIYSYGKRFYNKRTGMLALIFMLSTPLLIIYSSRSLQNDLDTTYFLLATTYAILRKNTSYSAVDKSLWAFFSGMAISSSLLTGTKGLLAVPLTISLEIFFLKKKIIRLSWPLLFSSIFCFYFLYPFWRAPQLLTLKTLMFPTLLFTILCIGMLALYRVGPKTPKGSQGSIFSSRGNLSQNIRSKVSHFTLYLLGLMPVGVWLYSNFSDTGIIHQMFLFPNKATTIFSNVQIGLNELLGRSNGLSVGTISLLRKLSIIKNIDNILYLLYGVFWFPSPILIFYLAGLIRSIYAFFKKQESDPLFIWLIIFLYGWVLKAYAEVQNGTFWRHFLLLTPFASMVAAKGAYFILKRRKGKNSTYILIVIVLFSILYTRSLFKVSGLQLVAFADPSRLSAWKSPSIVAWSIGLIPVLLYITIRKKITINVRWRKKISMKFANKLSNMRIILPLLMIAIILQVYLNPAILPFMDIEKVKDVRGRNWNARLQDPFDYISTHRHEFDSTVFLTLHGRGIEHYTNIPSIELTWPSFAILLWDKLNDSFEIHIFLERYNVKYMLIPTPINEPYGEEGSSFVNKTSFGEILARSSIVKAWDWWVLYNLTSHLPDVLPEEAMGTHLPSNTREINIPDEVYLVLNESWGSWIEIRDEGGDTTYTFKIETIGMLVKERP